MKNKAMREEKKINRFKRSYLIKVFNVLNMSENHATSSPVFAMSSLVVALSASPEDSVECPAELV